MNTVQQSILGEHSPAEYHRSLLCFRLLKVARRLLLFPLDMDAQWLQVPDEFEKVGSEVA